jgi:hypothetical protein
MLLKIKILEDFDISINGRPVQFKKGQTRYFIDESANKFISEGKAILCPETETKMLTDSYFNKKCKCYNNK